MHAWVRHQPAGEDCGSVEAERSGEAIHAADVLVEEGATGVDSDVRRLHGGELAPTGFVEDGGGQRRGGVAAGVAAAGTDIGEGDVEVELVVEGGAGEEGRSGGVLVGGVEEGGEGAGCGDSCFGGRGGGGGGGVGVGGWEGGEGEAGEVVGVGGFIVAAAGAGRDLAGVGEWVGEEGVVVAYVVEVASDRARRQPLLQHNPLISRY